MSPEPLAHWNAAAVEAALTGTVFAGRVHHLSTAPSTNTIAAEAANAGAPAFSVWVADRQTAGRGRNGHHWHSAPHHGLYLSVLLRPQTPPTATLLLSLATALALRSAVFEITGVTPDIRWPNDLLLNERKFAGILVETASANQTTLRHAIVGIGVNVNHNILPADLQDTATSLSLASGRRFSREVLLAAILRNLAAELTALEAVDDRAATKDLFLARFAAASTWVFGKVVTVGEDEGYRGVTAGLDDQGFLRVRDEAGTLRTVLSGGVRSREVEAGREVACCSR